jgi:DNA-binding NarL/FixJ family response regulator
MRRFSEIGGPGTLRRADLAVLRLASTGILNTEIAEHLGQSPADVRAAFERLFVTLGARSKLEAVLIAHRRGLFDLPDG